MKRNTILTSAVVLALGCGGTAAAQDSQECANSAMKLSAEIAQSTIADATKAEFMKALSEAQSGGLSRSARKSWPACGSRPAQLRDESADDRRHVCQRR